MIDNGKRKKMPVIFAGHGSPMNAIEDNEFRRGFADIVSDIEKPKAILAISAHWLTKGIKVRTAPDNPQINDMYGFPKELYEIRYEPKGDPALAKRVLKLMDGRAEADNTWGIDHGVWTVLCNMYPDCDVPVVMMSTPADYDAKAYFDICRNLSALSDEGVLILASGNVVHNLRLLEWNNAGGAPWAYSFDDYTKQSILKSDDKALLSSEHHLDYKKSVPSIDHFYPLLAAAGAAEGRKARVWNEGCVIGSISMTSYIFE